MNTMSQPSLVGVSLVPSRNRRFTRFLTTAPPSRLPTAKPYRLVPSSLGSVLNTSRLLAHDLPLVQTSSKSLLPVSRSSLLMPAPRATHVVSPSDRQPRATLQPSPSEHFSTTASAHTLQKAMLSLSRYLLRLISSLRHQQSLIIRYAKRGVKPPFLCGCDSLHLVLSKVSP